MNFWACAGWFAIIAVACAVLVIGVLVINEIRLFGWNAPKKTKGEKSL